MARGYPGAFGRKVNALWIWLPLALLFVAAVPRLAPAVALAAPRPARARAASRVSLAFFNHAHIGAVGAARLAAAALPARPAAVARRCGGGRPAAVRAAAAARAGAWLAVGAALPGRLPRRAQRRPNANVIDVGYSGVIGADALVDGQAALRRTSRATTARRHLRPGRLRRLRPVRAAAALERPLGRPAGGARGGDRVRPAVRRRCCSCSDGACAGPTLGVVLAYAWAAYPFTLLRLEQQHQRHARRGARARRAARGRPARRARARSPRSPG